MSLHSGVWAHSFPEDLILRSLARNGNEIISLRCTGELETHCVVLSALGYGTEVTNDKRLRACQKCNQRRRLLQFRTPFFEYRLSDFLDEQIEDTINDYVTSLKPNSWLKQTYLGVEIGRMASYEVILEHKLNSLNLSETLLNKVRHNARSAARVAVVVDRLITRHQPDALVVYNALYSANRVACLVAVGRGVRAWALHAGLNLKHRYSQMYLYPHNTIPGFSYMNPAWLRVKDQPARAESLLKVADHFLQQVEAKNRFVYSSGAGRHTANDIRSALGIRPSAKVLVATLSSEDEMMAARTVGLAPPVRHNPTFNSGDDWLEHLISFVRDNSRLHLVIRVHPREFPNKRETKLSESAERLKRQLVNLPTNVTVNWPDDGISLYDLAQVMDVCANYTSSSGIEMMLLGIPVVTPRTSFMAAYDPEISYFVGHRDVYNAQLCSALDHGYSVENTRNAFRWLAHILVDSAVDISDGFAYPATGFIPAVTPGQRSSRAKLIEFAARYAPPLLETTHILRRRYLKEVTQVDGILRSKDVGNGCIATTTGYENVAMAQALVPIVTRLETLWGPDVGPLRSLSHFVHATLG